jgi:CDP-diacylglycerol--glycerol-3-phosphate 3-phosphatidyltransferase
MTEGSLVPRDVRSRIRGAAVPLAIALGRLGLTPNALTVIGFVGVCSSAVLAGLGTWAAAGIVSLVFAAFDLLDGSLARATGRVSKFGAFLDSTLDRAGEGALYAGIVAGAAAAGAPALAAASAVAMIAAFLVSYSRARAEGLGFGGDVGVAPRAERVAIMGIGLIATGIAGGVGGLTATRTVDWISLPGGIRLIAGTGEPWLAGTLVLLFVLSTVTVLQRIWHVRAQARRLED